MTDDDPQDGDRQNDDLVVECRGVSVGYGSEVVVRDVDLAVRRGEIVALLGGSGSGKSTLLKAITGLLRPRKGEVRLFGRPLHDCIEAAGPWLTSATRSCAAPGWCSSRTRCSAR